MPTHINLFFINFFIMIFEFDFNIFLIFFNKNKYLINVSELYKNIINKKKFNYKIYLKNYKINIYSKITRVSNLI